MADYDSNIGIKLAVAVIYETLLRQHMSESDYMINVKEKRPLVHHITNYVTVNDCANVTIKSYR